jgi:hypothetical protein
LPRERAGYRAGWSLPPYHYQSAECFSNDLAMLREQL